MGGGGTGFVNAPLTSTEVRNFKKEIKGLLEDPIGTAEQLDQLLGPNIFTWEGMQPIMKIIFSQEEREMIRIAEIKICERENQQGPPGNQKMPITPPNWNQNDEAGRGHMNDYHNLIIKGIKEGALRGQNVKKAFEGQQGKEETPTEWLERLRKNMKQYSGIDPESLAGQALLRVNFVTHAWPDIRKKLEKIEDWYEKPVQDLVREAQKIYVRRDEEKAKVEAKIMVATMRESTFQKKMESPQVTLLNVQDSEMVERRKIKPQHSQVSKKNPGMPVFIARKKGILKGNAPT